MGQSTEPEASDGQSWPSVPMLIHGVQALAGAAELCVLQCLAYHPGTATNT